MSGLSFSSRYDDWTENCEGCYTSPAWRDDQAEQVMIFSTAAKDGSMEAEITAIDGGKGHAGDEKKEAGFFIRYSQSKEGYWAGLGAFATKFSIAKMTTSGWQLLDSTGSSSSIRYGSTYRVRVEVVGNKITLYENDVLLASAVDMKHIRQNYLRCARARQTHSLSGSNSWSRNQSVSSSCRFPLNLTSSIA